MSALVTAIIPTHRRPALVTRACRSVFAQTHRPLELIVVDDASGDETPQVLASLIPEAAAAGVAMRVLTATGVGPGQARNLAAREAAGEWLAFLDDDDEWLPGKTALQIAALAARPEAAACFGRFVHGAGGEPRPRPDQMHDGWVFGPLCTGAARAYIPTLMVRRAAFAALGGFLPLYNWEDTEFELRLALEHQFVAVHDVVAAVHTPGQSTVSREAGLQGDLERDALKLRVHAEFERTCGNHARFDASAFRLLRARLYDEHVKHLLWLGRVGDAAATLRRARAECGDLPLLRRLRRKLWRARLAALFGRKLRKP